jgi:LPXTG-site transpeptidase (sortase) family protein
MPKKKRKKVDPPANRIKFLLLGVFALAGLAQGLITGRTVFRAAQINTIGPTPLPTQPQEIIIPHVLRIPRLRVAAYIVPVGLNEQGEMAVPDDPFRVGWYHHSGQPGQKGSLVIGGHLDSTTGPAIFYRLSEIRIGDRIVIHDQFERSYTYEVVGKEAYFEEDFPRQEVFAVNDKKRLNLITCQGNYNKTTGRYDKRIVIYSELRESGNGPESNENISERGDRAESLHQLELNRLEEKSN